MHTREFAAARRPPWCVLTSLPASVDCCVPPTVEQNAATAATEHCVPRVIAAALKLYAQRRRSGSRRSRTSRGVRGTWQVASTLSVCLCAVAGNDFVRTWSLDAARSAAAEFAMHHAESAARSALETLLPPDLDADIR